MTISNFTRFLSNIHITSWTQSFFTHSFVIYFYCNIISYIYFCSENSKTISKSKKCSNAGQQSRIKPEVKIIRLNWRLYVQRKELWTIKYCLNNACVNNCRIQEQKEGKNTKISNLKKKKVPEKGEDLPNTLNQLLHYIRRRTAVIEIFFYSVRRQIFLKTLKGTLLDETM